MPRRSHAKPLLHSLHWLPVDQRIVYKMAVVTLKVQCTATPAYLSRHLQPRNCVRNLQSLDTPLLCQPFTKTDLARRGFRYSAPATWNSLPRTVLESPSITVFKSRLKTHLLISPVSNSNYDVTCAGCAITASEVTTFDLWRDRNMYIIIIIIIIITTMDGIIWPVCHCLFCFFVFFAKPVRQIWTNKGSSLKTRPSAHVSAVWGLNDMHLSFEGQTTKKLIFFGGGRCAKSERQKIQILITLKLFSRS